MSAPPPRSRGQRQGDTLAKLSSEVDLWVASADESGRAYLVPLSFHWDGIALTRATTTSSRTGHNLLRAGWARASGSDQAWSCLARGAGRRARQARVQRARRPAADARRRVA
jgi:Pyridoxamine 5'-phosphate oxidase